MPRRAINGGSIIGLGEALALRTGLLQIMLPHDLCRQARRPRRRTVGGRKTMLTDLRLQPQVALRDAELVRPLPARFST